MGLFNIDYNALVWQLLPIRLRKSVQFAWVKCLVTPVKYLYGIFSVNRDNNLYFLNHDSQVVYLEAALNDTFDATLRRIYIDDPVFCDPQFIYRRSESKPLWLSRRSEVGGTTYDSPRYLYRRSEVYSGTGTQFVVYVPTGLVYDTYRMKALIDRYRLVSKNNYTIVPF